MYLVSYQPDIPQNLGALMRLSVCFGAPLHVVEPCGFPFSAKAVRKAAMDYAAEAEVIAHASWTRFLDDRPPARLVLMTTSGAGPIWSHQFRPTDAILLGRESAGVPDEVHDAADVRARIPMPGGGRSLNVAIAAGIALAEASRQLSLV